MSNFEQKVNLVATLKLLGKPVTYFPEIAKALGSNTAAIFLSKMLYWEGKQEDEDGWIRKPMKEIHEEMGLSRHEMDTVRNTLKTYKLIEEKRSGVPAKLNFKIDWDMLTNILHNQAFPSEGVAPTAKEKPPTILYQMKEVFIEENLKENPEAAYEFIEKDWNHLRLLKKRLSDRIIAKKKKDSPDDTAIHYVEDDELLENFRVFLQMLPDFWKKNRFTPAKLNSDFSEIVQKIVTNNVGNNRKSPTNNGSGGFAANVKGSAPSKETDIPTKPS